MSRKDRVVVAQPAMDVWEYENHWHKNLTECYDDCGTCAYAWFCPCCYVMIKTNI